MDSLNQSGKRCPDWSEMSGSGLKSKWSHTEAVDMKHRHRSAFHSLTKYLQIIALSSCSTFTLLSSGSTPWPKVLALKTQVLPVRGFLSKMSKNPTTCSHCKLLWMNASTKLLNTCVHTKYFISMGDFQVKHRPWCPSWDSQQVLYPL